MVQTGYQNLYQRMISLHDSLDKLLTHVGINKLSNNNFLTMQYTVNPRNADTTLILILQKY